MKVLVAIDDSPYSDKVLNAVAHRHWPADTQFKIVTVVEPLAEEYRRIIEQENEMSMKEIEKKRKAHATEMCQKARHRIEEAVQGSYVHFEVRTGIAASEIMDSASEWPADRILVGAHGHTVCPHNMPGSVSRAVAHNAGCHVEVIRAKESVPKEVARAV
jgi:nucleotide-binding universal stress UspA family protein